MRRIQVLLPIEIVDFTGKSHGVMSFYDFACTRLREAVFGKNMSSLLSAVRVHDAIRRAHTEQLEVVDVEEADWRLLCQATENPARPYAPSLAVCVVPFMKAITEAPEHRA